MPRGLVSEHAAQQAASAGVGRSGLGPLRILHLANELACSGNGIVNIMVDLAIEQRRAGHEVAVGAPDGEYAGLLESRGVRHVLLPQAGLRNALGAAGRLAWLLRREFPNILHAHMVTGALAARLASAGTGTRVVTHVHNSWQRHATLMWAGHHVIAVSEAVRHEMIARGIPASRITAVLNGTIGSVRASTAPSVPGPTLDHPAVLSVAGMYARKGIADLIQAAVLLRKRVPHVRVYLAGDGPDRSGFERLARDLGVGGTVVFLGFRPDAERLMRQADAFVLASHAEPCGLVVAEARAAGVPVIATRVGGIPEMLDGGSGGLLVPPKAPAALAAALARVLLDEEFSAGLRRAASANLAALRVERMAAETEAVYRQVLAHG